MAKNLSQVIRGVPAAPTPGPSTFDASIAEVYGTYSNIDKENRLIKIGQFDDFLQYGSMVEIPPFVDGGVDTYYELTLDDGVYFLTSLIEFPEFTYINCEGGNLRFIGTGSYTGFQSYSAYSSHTDGMIRYDDASTISFENLTVETNGSTLVRNMNFFGVSASKISFKNCIFNYNEANCGHALIPVSGCTAYVTYEDCTAIFSGSGSSVPYIPTVITAFVSFIRMKFMEYGSDNSSDPYFDFSETVSLAGTLLFQECSVHSDPTAYVYAASDGGVRTLLRLPILEVVNQGIPQFWIQNGDGFKVIDCTKDWSIWNYKGNNLVEGEWQTTPNFVFDCEGRRAPVFENGKRVVEVRTADDLPTAGRVEAGTLFAEHIYRITDQIEIENKVYHLADNAEVIGDITTGASFTVNSPNPSFVMEGPGSAIRGLTILTYSEDNPAIIQINANTTSLQYKTALYEHYGTYHHLPKVLDDLQIHYQTGNPPQTLLSPIVIVGCHADDVELDNIYIGNVTCENLIETVIKVDDEGINNPAFNIEIAGRSQRIMNIETNRNLPVLFSNSIGIGGQVIIRDNELAPTDALISTLPGAEIFDGNAAGRVVAYNNVVRTRALSGQLTFAGAALPSYVDGVAMSDTMYNATNNFLGAPNSISTQTVADSTDVDDTATRLNELLAILRSQNVIGT